MTLKPRCECSTCDACPNPPDRSGTCATCFDGQPEFGYPAGSHEPLSDRDLDEIRDEDEYAAASLPASALEMYEVLRRLVVIKDHTTDEAVRIWDRARLMVDPTQTGSCQCSLHDCPNAATPETFCHPRCETCAWTATVCGVCAIGDCDVDDEGRAVGGRVCYICGVDDVDTTRARLGDVAGQVTAIADRIVNVCGIGKCDA